MRYGTISRTTIITFLLAFAISAGIFFAIHRFVDAPHENLAVTAFPVIHIAASSPELADIVSNVGGSRATVVTLHKETVDIKLFQDIKAVFCFGEGVDDWACNAAKENNIKTIVLSDDADIVDLSYQVEIGKVANNAPHYYWLAIHDAQNITVAIARELSAIDPLGQETYISNAYTYSQTLGQDQKTFEREIADLDNTKVLASDHAFDEFIHYAGLTAVGLFNMEGNRDEAISDLAYNARYYDVRAVLVPREYDQVGTLRDVLEKDGISVIELDTMVEGYGKYSSYRNFTRHNFSVFLAGMR